VSLRTQRLVYLVAAAVLGAALLWGLGGLPPVGDYQGPYGDVVNAVAVAERHAANVVAAVTFDYRGVDTMVEEYILFAAVIGVAILLRAQRDEEEREADGAEEDAGEGGGEVNGPRRDTSATVRVTGVALVGLHVLLGLYVVAHGHITPGGGFQGGVVLATGALMVYLAGKYVTLRRVSPQVLTDAAEAAGAGGYVAVGLIGVMAGGQFLLNVLPLGETGTLLSAGTIPVINLLVGLEVAAGFVLLLSEFLEQTLLVRGGPR
jgi:multicomponent Na+:H+ antiporter subunit B